MLRVYAQHQGALVQGFAARGPLLKRVVMRLQGRAVKWVECHTAKPLRQRIA